MKAKTSVLTLALCFVAGAVGFACDVQMGTWKLVYRANSSAGRRILQLPLGSEREGIH